ncbi:MAG: GIY-YIG nuclease family protein [Lachnospiraceae bacterium]|nr:GIY-YIG nuclease family protein [Lachnospiraceae bacterium]
MKRHYVYLLLCADGTLYTGYTTDPERRLKEHNAGKGARYTRGRLPARMIYTASFATRGEALREEYRIKRLTPAKKRALAGIRD